MRVLIACAVLLIVACQAPAPPTPTPTQAVPTVAPTPAPPAASASRVDALNAANAAFARGDLTTASGLFDRVVNTPPTGEPPATAPVLTSYAHFRAMVALLAAGRDDDARVHLEALQQADASGSLTRLAAQLWDQYGMVGQLRGACAQLQPQISSQASATLSTLQSAGVTVDAASLCSVPSA